MKRIYFLLVIAASMNCSNPCLSQGVDRPGTTTNHPALIPLPQEYSPRGESPLLRGVSIISGSDPADNFAAADLSRCLAGLDVQTVKRRSAFQIRLLLSSSREGEQLLTHAEVSINPQMHDEGYLMLPSANGIAVIADTATGLFYGVQTLKQMITGRGVSATFERALIRDWPAMRYRGLSDDLSRGPIPTLDFQKREIRTLAAYKMNVYSPYFETTLQYSSTPLTALRGGSLSPTEVHALVDYARQYHVVIVPEQEAFGHLHHLLTYEQYAPLAETPLGNVLAPGQSGSLDLIEQWFDEIAKMFPSPFLHIGADETRDLGRGQTKRVVEVQGTGKVYVDFLAQIHAKLAPLNRRLLFWGDVAMKDPSAVQHLPKDMIAVAWMYDPRPDGFARWLSPYIAAGLETWVAPGVNNWRRVFPDNNYAFPNIQGFVSDGQAAHSTGMLNTVWNDDGEELALNNWYGILFGAAASWQPGRSSIEHFQETYGRVFHGDPTGKIDMAQRELGSIYQMLDQAKIKETTDILFWADPWSTEGQTMAAELRPMLSALRLHAESAITLIADARRFGPLRESDGIDALELGARRFDFIGQKFETADEIARIYKEGYASTRDPQKSQLISSMLLQISSNAGLCEDMRDGYSATRSTYSSLWLQENRPYWLQNVLVRYDLATQLWVLRGNQFTSAYSHWTTQHTLPPPATLGIPTHEER